MRKKVIGLTDCVLILRTSSPLLSLRFGILADCYMARYPALKVDKDAEMARYRTFAERIRPMVTETISFIQFS